MRGLSSSGIVQITGKVVIAAIIVLFMVIVFILILYLYAKWFCSPVETMPPPHRHRRHHGHLASTTGRDHQPLQKGLDLAVIRSLPVVIFQSKDSKEMECAVCLSAIVEGDKARFLPNCNHGFHVGCIDMWFQSNSTCPLCRCSVSVVPQKLKKPFKNLPPDHSNITNNAPINASVQSPGEISASGYPTVSQDNPSNELVLRNHNQARNSRECGGGGNGSTSCSSAEGTSALSRSSSMPPSLVIDVTEHTTQENKAGQKPKTPMVTHVKSLKRLLSREKKEPGTRATTTSCSSLEV